MTEVSLREYFEQWQRSHEHEHALADRALTLAATLAESNKAAANEWRSAMTDRERTFLSKGEAEAEYASMRARLDVLTEANTARTAREQERERSQIRLMALIGLVATVASVALSLLIKLG